MIYILSASKVTSRRERKREFNCCFMMYIMHLQWDTGTNV